MFEPQENKIVESDDCLFCEGQLHFVKKNFIKGTVENFIEIMLFRCGLCNRPTKRITSGSHTLVIAYDTNAIDFRRVSSTWETKFLAKK